MQKYGSTAGYRASTTARHCGAAAGAPSRYQPGSEITLRSARGGVAAGVNPP